MQSMCRISLWGKISSMLERSKEYQKRCKEVCSDAEYDMLEKAFF